MGKSGSNPLPIKMAKFVSNVKSLLWSTTNIMVDNVIFESSRRMHVWGDVSAYNWLVFQEVVFIEKGNLVE